VEKLMQMTCSGSQFDTPESLSHSGPGAELTVIYEHAHFRCEQPVEAYLREEAQSLELLVQPIDMNPDAVAGCDCRYQISMQISLDSDAHQLTLFRRWDNLNAPNPPVRVGELTF
jgi:hypothetical protein